jgi:hypothetical protein
MLPLQTLRGFDVRDGAMRTFDLLGGRRKMGRGKINEKGKEH